MATSASGYGVTNPTGLDPYPIESTLYSQAFAGNPAAAASTADSYRFQNLMDKQNYEFDLQAQHEAYKQQLLAQMQETAMKEAPNWFKTPGLARLASASGLLPNIAPGDVGPSVGQAENAISATNLKDFGTGANQLSQGGYQFSDPNAIAGSPGGIGTNLGPAQVQAEKIKAATQLAVANLNAANAGNDVTSSMVVRDPRYGIDTTLHFGKKVGDAKKQQVLAGYGVPVIDQQPSNQALPGQASPGTVRTPGGDLPTAQVDTGGGGGGRSTTNLAPKSTSTSNTQAGVRDIQQNVVAKLPTIAAVPKTGAGVAADIRAGMDKNNGMPNVQPDGKGGFNVIGGSGRPYPW
jgi:hypothetical protein